MWVSESFDSPLSKSQTTHNSVKIKWRDFLPGKPGQCQCGHQVWEWFFPRETRHFFKGMGPTTCWNMMAGSSTLSTWLLCGPPAKLPPRWIFAFGGASLGVLKLSLGNENLHPPSVWRCGWRGGCWRRGWISTPLYSVYSTTSRSLRMTAESSSFCPFAASWHLMVYPTTLPSFRKMCLFTDFSTFSSKDSLHTFWLSSDFWIYHYEDTSANMPKLNPVRIKFSLTGVNKLYPPLYTLQPMFPFKTTSSGPTHPSPTTFWFLFTPYASCHHPLSVSKFHSHLSGLILLVRVWFPSLAKSSLSTALERECSDPCPPGT